MGFFDGFFGSSNKRTSSLPPYLEDFYKNQMMPRLGGMIDRPYPVYPGQRIEDFSQEEMDAFNRIASEARSGDAYMGGMGRAFNMTEHGASGYDPALLGPEGRYDPALLGPEGRYDPSLIGDTPSFSKEALDRYMSPYKGAVVDSAVSRINESADRAALRDRGRATRSGNLYSAGHGIIDAERDKNTMREIGDVTGRLMDQGYGQALSQFNTDTNRQLQAKTTDAGAKNRAIEFLRSQGLTREQANQAARNQADQFYRTQQITREQANQAARNLADQFYRTQQMAGGKQMATLAEQNQKLRNQSMNDLRAVGQAKRGMGQQGLDLAYKDFMDSYNWPLENLSKIGGVAGGQPYSKTETQTSSPSIFNTAAGSALIGSTLFPSWWGRTFGFADGGMVPEIKGPRGPRGPALSRPVSRPMKESHTPGRRAGLPPPMLNARKLSPGSFAA
ncbi:MAG: hypothetical protein FJX54_22190 [Alphaproteobacteria bacterium]|nr:hypothetical protein [Alphaproteobacteria bacterium]